MKHKFKIMPSRNYARLSHPGHVQTGQQILNLLELANPTVQAMLLLDIVETDKPATKPDDKYGIPDKVAE